MTINLTRIVICLGMVGFVNAGLFKNFEHFKNFVVSIEDIQNTNKEQIEINTKLSETVNEQRNLIKNLRRRIEELEPKNKEQDARNAALNETIAHMNNMQSSK